MVLAKTFGYELRRLSEELLSTRAFRAAEFSRYRRSSDKPAAVILAPIGISTSPDFDAASDLHIRNLTFLALEWRIGFKLILFELASETKYVSPSISYAWAEPTKGMKDLGYEVFK